MVCLKLGNSSIGARLTKSRNRGRCEAYVVLLAPRKEHRLIDDVVFFGDIYPGAKLAPSNHQTYRMF